MWGLGREAMAEEKLKNWRSVGLGGCLGDSCWLFTYCKPF